MTNGTNEIISYLKDHIEQIWHLIYIFLHAIGIVAIAVVSAVIWGTYGYIKAKNAYTQVILFQENSLKRDEEHRLETKKRDEEHRIEINEIKIEINELKESMARINSTQSRIISNLDTLLSRSIPQNYNK